MADLAALIVEVEGRGIKETTDRLAKLATEGQGAEQSTKSLQQQTDKLVSQLVLEGKAVNKTADEIKILKLQQAGASKAQIDAARTALDYKNQLLQQAEAAEQAAREQDELANSSNVVQGNFGAQKNAMQQVSFQLQDVAVQAQSGTSAFTILAQQGPQIASAFGPGGAVVGALIAFGAIVGGVVFSLLTARKSLEDLQEEVRGTGKEFGQLTAEAQMLIREMNDLEIKRLEKEIRDLSGEIVQTNADMGLAAAMAGGMNEELNGMASAANQAAVQIQLNKDRIQELKDENEGFSKSVSATLESLEEEIRLFGLEGRALDVERAKMEGANDEQLRRINLLYDELEALQSAEAAREKRKQDIEDERDRLAEANQEFERQARQAEKRLKQAETSGEDPIQKLERQTQERVRQLEADRLVAVVAAEMEGADVLAIEMRYADAITQLEQTTQDQIQGIRDRARETEERQQAAADARAEAQKARTEAKKRQLEAQAERERIESQQNVTNSLLHFENMLLQGKSETTRAAVQLGINLADAEKRENATKIISDSYSAAMGAYKALAGIPVIGPALGAAAAGTIIAAGATYAAASLQGRATGGQVRGGESYLVGERGPELLTMGTSGRIASNDQLKKAVGGGESIQIVNNVDARGAGPDVDQKIRQAMKQTSEMTTANIQNLMRRRRFP